MKSHATLEDLSGYLDQELEAGRRRLVEEHVAECPACRQRLEGLGRVVSELEQLTEIAPPSHLGRLVENRVRQKGGPGALRRRLLGRERRLPPPAALAPLFGVVVALSIIAYLLSMGIGWLERRSGEDGTPATPRVETSDAGAGQTVRLEIAGRSLRWIDGRWVEQGIDPAAPAERLDPERAAAGDPALAAEIEALRMLDARVRLRIRDRVVELDLRR